MAGVWKFYGSFEKYNNVFESKVVGLSLSTSSTLPPLSDSEKKIALSSWSNSPTGGYGYWNLDPPTNGLLTDQQTTYVIAQVAKDYFQLPLTVSLMKKVAVGFNHTNDFWDNGRDAIAASVAGVGAALAPFTFGISAVVGGVAANRIAANKNFTSSNFTAQAAQQQSLTDNPTFVKAKAKLEDLMSSPLFWPVTVGFVILAFVLLPLLRRSTGSSKIRI